MDKFNVLYILPLFFISNELNDKIFLFLINSVYFIRLSNVFKICLRMVHQFLLNYLISNKLLH